jgi:hypothetical protein
MPIHLSSPTALLSAGARRAAWWNSPPLYCLAMSCLAVACLALVCLISPGSARAGTVPLSSSNGNSALPFDQPKVSTGAVLAQGLHRQQRRNR